MCRYKSTKQRNYFHMAFSLNRGPALKVKFTATPHELVSATFHPQNNSDKGLEWELEGEGNLTDIRGKIERWIDCFCSSKQPDVIIPVILDHLPRYTKRVLTVLQEIPFGTTLTYQELAKLAGSPQAARAVGSACGRNPCPLIIPCHRVLASNGLGGFSAGLDFKKALLAFEKSPMVSEPLTTWIYRDTTLSRAR